jgi:protocatechuate 3,4-dioxygenase beta subunit
MAMDREIGLSGVDRRRLLAMAMATSAAALLSKSVAAALLPTPEQSTGPFYPVSFPLDADADLLTVAGQAAQAQGTPTYLLGGLLDTEGRPVRGARIEIWQCDAFGRYHHPRQGGGADPAFQGFGAATADAEGAWRFRTIRPVPYPGRAPHIHFAVFPPGGERFTTQMYVAGEAGNEADFLLSRVRDPAARARLIVPLQPADDVEAGALLGRFDIVLGQA